MVCWLVGGKCVKAKLPHINIRQLQTVLNIKIEQYKQLFYQPKPSQASRGGLRGSNLQAWPNPNFSEVFFGEASSVISCPRSTTDRPRHFQTSIWANRNNFPINQNHPRHLWPKFKKSEILTFFWNRSSDFDPPRLNWQHQPRLKWTKMARHYMDMLLWAKRWHNKSGKMADP